MINSSCANAKTPTHAPKLWYSRVMIGGLAVFMGLAVVSCSSDAKGECEKLAEQYLAQMAKDYPDGPVAEEVMSIEVLSTDPLECRGRVYYENSQVATMDFDREFYRTGEGTSQ